eukprot:scaffold1506_cov179-Amphora_coffeaeformis.AAC.4
MEKSRHTLLSASSQKSQTPEISTVNFVRTPWTVRPSREAPRDGVETYPASLSCQRPHRNPVDALWRQNFLQPRQCGEASSHSGLAYPYRRLPVAAF